MRWIVPCGCVGLVLFLLSSGRVAVLDAGQPALSESQARSVSGAVPLELIALEDQFGQPHTYGFPAEGPMVLLVADKKGYEALGPWIEAVRVRAGDPVAIVGIADVRAVPGFLRGKVRRKFAAGQARPILLDWQGDVLNRLNPEKGVPNAYLISASGSLVFHAAGLASEANLKDLQCRLESEVPAAGSSTVDSRPAAGPRR